MQGGRNKQPLGYTVIEVLIVLAISSFMFLIAANFINGKQEHTAFIQGVNETASRLQDMLSQVTDGHYSDVPINCTANAGGIIFGGASPGQGRNQDCVFLGKVMHFYIDGGTTYPQNYETFSMAAARTATGQLPSTFVGFISPNFTTKGTIAQNLELRSMKVKPTVGGINSTAYNIGFAQGLGTPDALGAVDPTAPTYESGTQSIGLIYASSGLNKSISKAGAEGTISGPGVRPATYATMCFSDGTRWANIFIGGDKANGNQLSIKVQQLGKTPCP